MGIKPTYVKTLSAALVKEYPERFSRDFEENKHAVAELASIGSKKVRNRVAGSVTRRLNARRKAK
ncbi:MAG: 30S ribosomal protein S17e [Methanomicrobiales archaeon]|nr:30S ribosomal protein S17e [Methanomicrobiales archaeon]